MSSVTLRNVAIVVGSAGAFGLLGCETACDQETVNRAVAFLDANQSCETNDNCTIVSDFCEAIPSGRCGQIVMNRQGAESGEWRSIESELADCGPDECAVDNCALVPGCTNGSCRNQ